MTLILLLDHIPADLQDPFYTDQYEQEHIKPQIIRLLLSGDLYCRVCGLILHTEQAASLQSHQSVIQALSRKGIYVLESDDTHVSEMDLSSAPIKMVGILTVGQSHYHLAALALILYGFSVYFNVLGFYYHSAVFYTSECHFSQWM